MKAQHAGDTIVNALKAPWIAAVFAALLLSACGGGGDSSNSANSTSSSTSAAPLAAAVPSLTFVSVKTFRFSWTDVSDATYYKLLENPNGNSGFTQVGDDIPQGTRSIDHVVPLYARVNAQYLLQSCNAVGCTDSATVSVSGTLGESVGYVKASNTSKNDHFGDGHIGNYAVSLSADGRTLAVGAYGEDGDATNAGAVYVFARTDGSWKQQAYVKASNPGQSDYFGLAVSLSADGNTLAVGAPYEDDKATDAGAVYVFTRTDGSWTQQAYVKASNAGERDVFGTGVSLSGDGDTLAVGAYGEDGEATNAGAVYVFARTDGSWKQQAYVKASNAGENDYFGLAISLSADGNTLAVGSPDEDSKDTGTSSDGNQSDNSASEAGAAYVFTRTDGSWKQQAYVKASNTGADQIFGVAVSLSSDGETLAVGSSGEAGSAGAVYVFIHGNLSVNGNPWRQQAYVKASNAGADDFFGWAVSLSADGDILAVGAYGEDSNATGINGNQSDNSASAAGAAYVFIRTDGSWKQQAYVNASNAGENNYFGSALSLSGDGDTLAVGAYGEDSNATGVNGDQSNDDASDAGAVYLY